MTDVPLREHLERRLDDLARMLDERYQHQATAVAAALAAQVSAMETAFAAADKAVDRALAATNMALDKRTDTLDREFHEHLEQVRHENALAFVNSDKAIQAAMAAAKEAVTKAEIATEKRFESVNEFRSQLADQTASFMPREVADATFTEIRSQMRVIDKRLDTASGKGLGVSALAGWIVAGISLVVSVIIAANALSGRA